MSHRRHCFPVLVALPLLLTACGSGSLDGGSTGSSSSGGTSSTAAGIWNGTDSASGLTLTGIINAAGLADFIRSDGAQYTGTTDVSGSTLTMTLNTTTQFGSGFSDGSNYAIGSLNGTVTTATSLSGTVNLTTTDNNTISSTWSLSFNSLYNNASSDSTVSGNYNDQSTGDPMTGSTWSITSNGAMTAQSGTNGCVLNGQIATADTSFNAYEVSYTLASCQGDAAVLNGIAFTGLAVLNTGSVQAQLVLGVTGESTGGVHYGITSGLTRT